MRKMISRSVQAKIAVLHTDWAQKRRAAVGLHQSARCVLLLIDALDGITLSDVFPRHFS
jgi:hypothetical protein